MEELVDLLKQTRQEKGITLEEISRQTKIQLRYLEALENSDFSSFAGEVYLKGALVNYANIIGLDSKEVLALYHRLKENKENQAGEEPGETKAPAPPRAIKKRTPKSSLRSERQEPTLTAGVIVLVLVLIAAGIWFSQNFDWRDLRPGPEQGNQEPEDNPLVEEEPEEFPETGPQPQVTVQSSSANETSFLLNGFTEIEMALTFEGPCWVHLIADGNEPFYPRTFTAGEEYTINAAETIRLRMGNPPAVRVTVNGIELTENLELVAPHNFRFTLD